MNYKDVAKNVFKETCRWVFDNYGLSLLSVISTLVIGYVKEVPIFHIYVGAFIVGACTMLMLNSYFDYKQKRLIRDKITFSRITRAIKSGDGTTKAIQFGIEVINTSNYQLESELSKISSNLGDCYSPKKELPSQNFKLQPKQKVIFQDHAIEFHEAQSNFIVGKVACSIKYGKPGKMKYDSAFSKEVVANFQEGNFFDLHYTDTIVLDSS